MKIINPQFEVWTELDDSKMGCFIEKCARNCYKSEGIISKNSYKKIINNLIKNGHTAMLEHSNITVKLTTDLHSYKDLTRHRHASFAIESTRWCSYNNDKFGNELTFVKPYDLEVNSTNYRLWEKACQDCEITYLNMKNNGATNDQASQVLNQSIKADVVMTCNIREWRYILNLRTQKDVFPNIRILFQSLLKYFIIKLPTFFGDMIDNVTEHQKKIIYNNRILDLCSNTYSSGNENFNNYIQFDKVDETDLEELKFILYVLEQLKSTNRSCNFNRKKANEYELLISDLSKDFSNQLKNDLELGFPSIQFSIAGILGIR